MWKFKILVLQCVSLEIGKARSLLLETFSEKRKVLHESFLAEGLNLDGVVRLLSLRFMGIHLR